MTLRNAIISFISVFLVGCQGDNIVIRKDEVVFVFDTGTCEDDSTTKQKNWLSSTDVYTTQIGVRVVNGTQDIINIPEIIVVGEHYIKIADDYANTTEDLEKRIVRPDTFKYRTYELSYGEQFKVARSNGNYVMQKSGGQKWNCEMLLHELGFAKTKDLIWHRQGSPYRKCLDRKLNRVSCYSGSGSKYKASFEAMKQLMPEKLPDGTQKNINIVRS